MDNQQYSTPPPQNDPPQPIQPGGEDSATQQSPTASGDDAVEAARRAIEEAQQSNPTPSQPATDSVQSFQIPRMPQAEPAPQPPVAPPSEPPQAQPQPQEAQPHTIQTFKRRRAPGDEQTTRMPQAPGAPHQPVESTAAEPTTLPSRSAGSGSASKTPLQPIGETLINNTPEPVAPEPTIPEPSAAPTQVPEEPAQPTQPPAAPTPSPTPETPQPAPSPEPIPAPEVPTPQPTPIPEAPETPPVQSSPGPSQPSWHIKPAFSEGVIGVGNSTPQPEPVAPEPTTAVPELSAAPTPTPEAPTPPPTTPTPTAPQPAPAPAQTAATPTPAATPQPSAPQAQDNASFQIPPSSSPSPAPAATAQPQAAPAMAPSAPTIPETEAESSDKSSDKSSKALVGGLTAKKDALVKKFKAFNFKPFVSAGLMGIAVFAVFNSQVILGQVQYLTTPSGGVESGSVLGSDAPVGEENRILIPKINVDVPVVYDITSFDEDEVQAGLERGVVHYGTTAMPGEIGNSVIVGHSSNNWWDSGEYKFAFILLDRLDDGDEIILHYEGVRYVYEVTRTFVVEPSDVSVLRQGDESILTLITCTPPGTSWQRLILQAEQVSPDPGENEQVGVPTQVPDELPSDLPRDNTSGFFDFWRNLF